MESASSSPTEYEAALRWIYDRINYERIRPKTASGHFRLNRIRHLLELVGSPQKSIPAVHIAGTKGKGSTAAFLASVLSAAGIRTALFTSPHVHDFEERMSVDSVRPSSTELTQLVDRLRDSLTAVDESILEGGPTYFEVATVLAWMYFIDRQADVAVLETGLGGRLDCTNVCEPLVSVITAIGLDHTHILGDTIEKIAAEKAGIIKPNVPVISWTGHADADGVVEEHSKRLNCHWSQGGVDFQVTSRSPCLGSQTISITTPWRSHHDLTIPLAGEHQAHNAALAVCTADLLAQERSGISPDVVRDGLASTVWPLRFELRAGEPDVLLDAAHNPAAVAALVKTIHESQLSLRDKKVLIFASSRDKDAVGMLEQLQSEFDDIVLTRFLNNPRTFSPEELNSAISTTGCTTHIAETPDDALMAARQLAGRHGYICVTGSIFLAAEVRQLL